MSKATPNWLQEIRDYWSQLVEEGETGGRGRAEMSEGSVPDFGDGERVTRKLLARELTVITDDSGAAQAVLSRVMS